MIPADDAVNPRPGWAGGDFLMPRQIKTPAASHQPGVRGNGRELRYFSVKNLTGVK
jgi:hypothetical protein